MSPEQIAELKPRDRLMSRLLRKAEFVRHTAHGVVIRWEGEREEGELYGLSDPILKSLTFYGHRDPGERPWFDPKIKPIRSRRTTGKSRGRARRRSTRRGSRRDSRQQLFPERITLESCTRNQEIPTSVTKNSFTK